MATTFSKDHQLYTSTPTFGRHLLIWTWISFLLFFLPSPTNAYELVTTIHNSSTVPPITSSPENTVKIGFCLPLVQWTEFVREGGLETVSLWLEHLSSIRPALLPNATVQLVIFDSGDTRPTAFRALIQNQQQHRFAALVGCGYSVVTEPVALISSSIRMPHCCGAITSPIYSDKTNFPTLFRTIASDVHRAEAYTNLVVHFKWKRVSIVYSDEPFGQGLFDTFEKLASTDNISVLAGSRFSVDTSLGRKRFERIVDELKQNDARIILFFSNTPTDFTEFLQVAKEEHITGPGYAYLASEIDDALMSTDGILDPDTAGLLEGTLSLRPLFTTKPPVYQDFLQVWKSRIGDKLPRRTPPQDLPNYSPLYMTCFELLLQGFDKKLKSNSSLIPRDLSNGASMRWKIPSDFYTPDQMTISGPIRFDEHGDREPMYNVLNVRNGKAVSVGSVTVDQVNLDPNATILFHGKETSIPSDRASDTEFIDINLGRDTIAYVIYVLSGMGILVCFGAGSVLYVYRDELKHTSPNLGGLYLVGTVLCFLSNFTVLIFEQREYECGAYWWILSLSYNIAFASLFVKNLLIYRIFHARTYIRGISPRAVLLQVLLLVLIGVSILTFLTAIGRPWLAEKMFATREFERVCVFTNENEARYFRNILFVYFFLLMFAGTYVAVMTRKVPARFRDSFHSGLCIYNITIVATSVYTILTFVPTHVVAQFAIRSFAALYLGYSNLFIFFFPKIQQVWDGESDAKAAPGVLQDSFFGRQGDMDGIGGDYNTHLGSPRTADFQFFSGDTTTSSEPPSPTTPSGAMTNGKDVGKVPGATTAFHYPARLSVSTSPVSTPLPDLSLDSGRSRENSRTDRSLMRLVKSPEVSMSVLVQTNRWLNTWSLCKAVLLETSSDIMLSIGSYASASERVDNATNVSALRDATVFLISRSIVTTELFSMPWTREGDEETHIRISTIEKEDGYPQHSIVFKVPPSDAHTEALATRLTNYRVKPTILTSGLSRRPSFLREPRMRPLAQSPSTLSPTSPTPFLSKN